jgi:hypothetical protein
MPFSIPEVASSPWKEGTGVGGWSQARSGKGSTAIALAVLLLVLGCNGPGRERVTDPAVQLAGTWSLATVDGQPPATVNVKNWELTIDRNGKWSSAGEMQGPWAGMHLSGDGTWKVTAPGRIQYTAGEAHGTLSFQLTANNLILSPDPVLVKPGKPSSVVAVYERMR